MVPELVGNKTEKDIFRFLVFSIPFLIFLAFDLLVRPELSSKLIFSQVYVLQLQDPFFRWSHLVQSPLKCL